MYANVFISEFVNYKNYLIGEILHPHQNNFFYILIGLSLLVWLFELIVPWRKNQKAVRRDFWLDGFYMFFNVFIFSLIGFHAVSEVVVEFFDNSLRSIGIENLILIKIHAWHPGLQLLFYFILTDFMQWNIHRLLHRVPMLWKFHKIHHSVKEMGFAAHLRFHWLEIIVYKSLQYIPLAMLGLSIQNFFLLHVFSLFIGHINHANLNLSYGPLGYILNNPKMHIWHHAKRLPSSRKYGVNFGLTLSIWDYLFSTAYIPKNGRDEELGFDDDEDFPQDFIGQQIFPFRK